MLKQWTQHFDESTVSRLRSGQPDSGCRRGEERRRREREGGERERIREGERSEEEEEKERSERNERGGGHRKRCSKLIPPAGLVD